MHLDSKDRILTGQYLSLSKGSSFLKIGETIACFKQPWNSPLIKDLLRSIKIYIILRFLS